MKKQFLISCFVLLATVSYTQNYQLIQPANEQHFLFVNPINSTPNYEREIRSIRIDSISVQGTEIYYYNHKILEEDFNSITGCNADYSDSSWLGHQIIQSNNGNYVFFNNQLDSIVIQTLSPLNSTWTLYQFNNGDYIEATVSSFDTATILNNLDSIKTLSLQVKDAANNMVTHPMNNETLQFSKQNGWVQFFNFHEFPNSSIPYNLVGSSAQPNLGISNPTQIDFFNYDVGDEIHILETYSVQLAQQFGCFKKIKTILAKTVSANQDTITYSSEECVLGIQSLWGTADTTQRTDTIIQTIILSEIVILDKLTHELLPASNGYSITSIRNFARTRRQKVVHSYYYYDTNNSCWSFYPNLVPLIWIEGLGGPFRNGPVLKELPVYYKKGNQTWGTPLDCTVYLDLEIISANHNSIKVFPNPFLESTTIQIEAFDIADNWSIQLLDLTGKIVRSTSIQEAQFTLHKENLPAGVYFYQINNTQQQKQYTGKLIIQ